MATSPEDLHDWLARLRQDHPQASVAICLEQPAANLILFLETYSWITLYAINPISLQKFRETFVTSRAKDDGKDAEYLAQLLLNHHDKLKAWQPDDTQTRQLQQLVSHRRAVVDERTGLTNRLKALLKQYFPQALDLCGEDLWRPLATAFLLKTIEQFDQEIANVFQQHPDREIFEALPGAGPVLAPRLLASMGSERERYARPENLQCFSGVAPVTQQSGGKCHIHHRYLCPKFLRQSFHEYAKESILHSRWAAAYYGQQRNKGCAHHTAVRALAYKWQRVIWKCWQTRTIYKEEIYEAALKKNKSPLSGLLDQIELGKSPVKTRAKKS